MDRYDAETKKIVDDVQAMVQKEAMAALLSPVAGRRSFVVGMAGLAFTVACKSVPSTASKTLDTTPGATGGTGPFLKQMQATEAAYPLAPLPNTALLPPPGGLQSPVPAVQAAWRSVAANKPWADYIDTRRAHGLAVAEVIKDWLYRTPDSAYQMLSELRASQPLFIPQDCAGPVMITTHDDVLAALTDHVNLTVDDYATEMRKTMQGPIKTFILCTDDASLYQPDSDMLRSIVRQGDVALIRSQVRDACDAWVTRAKTAGSPIDYVQTLARYVPVQFAAIYLGAPAIDQGAPCYFDPGTPGAPPLVGGGTFAFDVVQAARYTTITSGLVPTPAMMYDWGQKAYHNFFNNVGGDPDIQAAGLKSSELIQAYLDLLIDYWLGKVLAAANNPAALAALPDNMMLRLLRLQNGIDPNTTGVSPVRYTNQRVRENVFGTLVGALVNQELAATRILDSLLKLNEGTYTALTGSFAEVQAAAMDDDPANAAANNELIRKYCLEALRLEPQGAVLLRHAPQDFKFNGQLIKANTKVFVAHGSAMQDMPDADKFKIDRAASSADEDKVYLQHGYDRHKCLGRYVSPMLFTETTRAILRLRNLKRQGGTAQIVMQVDQEQNQQDPTKKDSVTIFPSSFMLEFS